MSAELTGNGMLAAPPWRRLLRGALALPPAYAGMLVLLALAGLNLVSFHRVVFRDIAVWDNLVKPPLKVQLSGAASLALWSVIIVLGRLIAYFPAPIV